MPKKRKNKISKHWLKRQMKEEFASSESYKKLAKMAMTKGERKKFLAMAKDEARHATYLQEMLDRRYYM